MELLIPLLLLKWPRCHYECEVRIGIVMQLDVRVELSIEI